MDITFFQKNPWIILVIALEVVLKAIALWKAARKGDKYWYIALLVLNTAGILPLVYIYFFSKKKQTQTGDQKLN